MSDLDRQRWRNLRTMRDALLSRLARGEDATIRTSLDQVEAEILFLERLEASV